jgi:hypothetical protein
MSYFPCPGNLCIVLHICHRVLLIRPHPLGLSPAAKVLFCGAWFEAIAGFITGEADNFTEVRLLIHHAARHIKRVIIEVTMGFITGEADNFTEVRATMELTRCMTDSIQYPVPLFLNRSCDRTLGRPRHRGRRRGGVRRGHGRGRRRRRRRRRQRVRGPRQIEALRPRAAGQEPPVAAPQNRPTACANQDSQLVPS